GRGAAGGGGGAPARASSSGETGGVGAPGTGDCRTLGVVSQATGRVVPVVWNSGRGAAAAWTGRGAAATTGRGRAGRARPTWGARRRWWTAEGAACGRGALTWTGAGGAGSTDLMC